MAKASFKKVLLTLLRWSVAVVGIWWVVTNLNLHDHVRVLDPATQRPVEARVLGAPVPPDDTWPLQVELPSGLVLKVSRDDVLTRPDNSHVYRGSDGAYLKLLALDQPPHAASPGAPPPPRRLLVSVDSSSPGFFLRPDEVRMVGATAPGYRSEVEFPARETGMIRMFAGASTDYLLLSLLVIPVIYLITGYRWWLLLRSLEISISLPRALQVNAVGAFYNTFMPGSTGGDVLKAYYAAKLAPAFRTRAVISVIVDRIIGLIALILMGGFCASMQWQVPQCRQVAIVAGFIIVATTVFVVVFGYRRLRNLLGLTWLLGKLPLQEKVDKATDALRACKRRPVLMLAILAMSFPVHATIVVSAMFAGWAFHLPLYWTYYWVVVPTVVLSGALPISPQGAGVMEFFAILLTKPQGATIAQAFALTMSIRLVQIVWNLACGVLVLLGGYHAPTAEEEKELEGAASAQ
jgi:uncharacterized protein (TIRG00374 family)